MEDKQLNRIRKLLQKDLRLGAEQKEEILSIKQILLDIKKILKEREELNYEKILKYRLKERALKGTKISIPFNDEDGIEPKGEKYYFSEMIDCNFIVRKITATYPIGAGILKLYPFVSEEKNETMTGYNLLQKYSPTPYLVLSGGGGKIEVNLDPRIFLPKNYIKLYFKNEDNETRKINVKVEIITFPLYEPLI
jgi:hypothetical protein